ncbi:MAG: hypothetical protein ACFFCV_15835 [Promethearchaeota archaeon]
MKDKKFQILLILVFFCLPSLFFINSTPKYSYFTRDLTGLHLSADPNVELISESGITTKWDFIDESAGYNTLYFQPFNNISNRWKLIDVSNLVMDFYVNPTDDAPVRASDPDTEYGAGGNHVWHNEWETFIKEELPYLLDNYTSNTILKLYAITTVPDTGYVKLYTTSDFDQDTITWNNQPSEITYLSQTYISSGATWYEWDAGDPNIFYYNLISDTVDPVEVDFLYTEYYNPNFRPRLYYYLSKIYQGSGVLYSQTDTTETLTLRNPDDLNLDLHINDKVEIIFNTSSPNRIDFNLRNNGVQQKSYILSSQGNGNFETRTQMFTINSNMTIDQLEFTGTFDDTKNLVIDSIKISRPYTEIDSYYLAPYERRELTLSYPNNYTIEIYENDILKEIKQLETSATLQTLIYKRIDDNIVYVNYFDANNEHLDFNDYITYVNYTLENFTYSNKRLSSNILYVDIDTSIQLKIYDSFNALVKTYETYEETFIDITLNVYKLKIKNEYHNPVYYELNNIDTEIIKSGNIFSEEIIKFSLTTGTYKFNYTKDGKEESIEFVFSSHQILVINSSKLCFLTYTNQKGEYLFFNNYKTYVDGNLIYSNVFYRDVGENISVEIKDLFDISIKNYSFIVQAEDNYVPIILTEYSLKIMNQQELFNHINITRDPNYYESPYSWSEWIAPNEIIKFNLFAGYYKINLTDNEGGSYSYYSYTLSGDDILLINSDNVLSQVIYNIANVNATIGNQITNVQIDLTNQNSAINNSIININIDLSNVNSTLGDLLLNLDVDIENIANNISTLYMFTNTSFININNIMNTSFVYIENNLISINQSISNLVIGVSNDVYLINGTISTMISQLETNLLLMNISIDTALFDLDTTIDEIGSNITNNYILLNNSITLTNTNINDSRIAILNNLVLVNNTICDLVSQVYSSVYLINNSIYNAVLDLGTSLSLINNTISGNLSIVLQQNDFLTELYKMTMFSELLNWTNVGLNTSLLTSQIDAWEFINNYRNESVQVLLKYKDKIDYLTVSAQNTIEQYLPKEDVEYRLKSVETGEYLSDWEDLPETKTVDFGFFEAEVPDIPKPIINDTATVIAFWILAIIIAIVGVVLYIKIRSATNRTSEIASNGRYRAYRKFRIRLSSDTKFAIGVAILVMVAVALVIFIILR